MAIEKATFAAGCFWGVETTFRQLDGVSDAVVGYTGGTSPDPTYQMVCSGRTGHAEAVQVEYDSERISYDQLVEAFWAAHDPTTADRQGPDIGTQYRSAIFCHSPEQEEAATAAKTDMDSAGRFARPIVTQIAPATQFYPAEDYHQRYFEKRGIVHH
jgi:peptide-methionine (S)-S-oxide reductase